MLEATKTPVDFAPNRRGSSVKATHQKQRANFAEMNPFIRGHLVVHVGAAANAPAHEAAAELPVHQFGHSIP